ncbi:prepilin-type N-terminal cleavage/methylation domain-containing protein [Vreelandella utahensis]|uniref:prepilin-type N-terminal cleavage/methylation domain-containing protein n=1 Tax=Vreelandella halophila TaxID=86177 RepID=UPI001C4DF384|nr:prepilin-type N-terminal cleavage/methylation domain-containing protein [Halomonas utahensis]
MRCRGFTLIELIIVIILLGIVSTISVRFITLSTQGAVDTSARQQSALSGVVISEQISRALREALPTSVRVKERTDKGDCIEWMPVKAASNYLNLPKGSDPSGFDAIPLPVPDDENKSRSETGRVVVYGYSGDVYNPTDPGPISPPASMDSSGRIDFDGGEPHRFTTGSPRKRFFIVDSPRTLCQNGEFLYRYRNYGIQPTVETNLPTSMPNREVLAANLASESLSFNVSPPTLKRGAIVSVRFTLEGPDSGETLDVSQEVQIRNVP